MNGLLISMNRILIGMKELLVGKTEMLSPASARRVTNVRIVYVATESHRPRSGRHYRLKSVPRNGRIACDVRIVVPRTFSSDKLIRQWQERLVLPGVFIAKCTENETIEQIY